MGWSVKSIAIILSLAFTLGCTQVKEVKEGFKESWEDTKKVFSGKEEKPAKDAKTTEAKTKAKDSSPAEATQDSGKKPAQPSGAKPEGIFGPK
jgi:hypothetical protein